MEPRKILLVEDEEGIINIEKAYLEKAGFQVEKAMDGNEALEQYTAFAPDLVVLDLMLPKKSGEEVLQSIKEQKDTPVIIVSAKSEEDDRVENLRNGADDYMVKPFEIVELLARVNIVLRRYNKMEQQLTFKDIAIDTKNQNVSKAGKHIELTPKEFELLELLMRNKNITLFREKIYEEIWGSEYSVESRTLDLHIQRLRKKLDIGDSLKTVFKAGYRLEE